MSAAQPPPAQVKNALGALKKQRSENRSHRRSLSGGTLDLSPEALAAPMKAMHVGGSRGASPSPASSPSTSPTGTTMTAHEKLKAASKHRRLSNGRASPTPIDLHASGDADAKARDVGDGKSPTSSASGPAFEWLLRRQMEVEMMFRGEKPATWRQCDVVRVRDVVARFAAFFVDLHAAAASLPGASASSNRFGGGGGGGGEPSSSCAPSTLFQELLHRVSGVNAGRSMDEQKREGNVPMHQAKVLDRRHRTNDECAGMDESLGSERVMNLVASVKARSSITLVPIRPRRRGERRSLRTLPLASLRPGSLAFNPDTPRRLSTPPLTDAFRRRPFRFRFLSLKAMRAALKVKMEDPNDVRMAEEAVKGADAFFTKLREHAEAHGLEDVDVLRSLRDA